MGFRLKLVVTSQVSSDLRAAILAAAIARWPFCRGPRDPAAYPDRAVFAPPELTSYLFDETEADQQAREQGDGLFDVPAAEQQAMEQADDVEAGLSDFSRAFPDVAFAFVEADCVGGTCWYRGFCCRDGRQFLVEKGVGDGRLVRLAGGVGIEITGRFEPFVRGFFAGPGSGGFE